MTNKEICIKAVSAYYLANPDVETHGWKPDPTEEGVAILDTENGKVCLRSIEAAPGYEILDKEIPADGPASQSVQQKKTMHLPEYKAWSQLPETGTGAAPVLLTALGIVLLFVGVALFNTVTVFYLAYVISCFAGAAVLFIAASIIKSIRATQAHAAYIEALMVYIANKVK